MITAQHQMPLPLRDARWRPCADVRGLTWALDISSEEIDPLIDTEQLIAFNIALRNSSRRELRFLTRSVEHYRATLGSRLLELTEREILRLLIPHDKPLIAGTEFDVAFNCDPDHRQHLIEAGQLQILRGDHGRDWRPGPGGSPAITRASFEQFVKEARRTSYL